MAKNIADFKNTERIKLSYLKHKGNVLAIAEDLGMDVEYIQRMVKKFKGKETREVSTLISNTIMANLMLGYESRTSHLMNMLRVIEGRDQLEVSICCEAPVKIEKGKTICLACEKVTDIKILDKEGILDVKLGIIEQLREEDKTLMTFAEKMGYTNFKSETPTQIVKLKQNFLITPGASNGGLSSTVVEDMAKLSPLERDKLIEKLRTEISNVPIETEIVSKEGNTNE